MRKMAAIAGLIVMISSGVGTAMEAEEAHAYLQGTWRAATETWIFEGDRWQQFNGGVTTDTTFTTIAMPADMFIVVSGETGRRYIVHATPKWNTMSWFVEGQTEQIGYYTRQPAE